MGFLNKLYNSCPVFLQNGLISLYGYYWKNRRYGGCFKRKLIEYKQRENFTKKQWDDFQILELRKLLIHAFTTVPFYQELYSKVGLTLKDFENFEINDLNKLPYLEKEDVRKFGTTTLLSNKREKGKFYKSSGSTGTPTQIYFSKQFHQTWSALYEVRVRNWANVDYQLPRAMIGGRRILPTSKFKKPFYRMNIAESQAYFSAYHISDKTAQDYIDGLKQSKSKYLVGYAMSIYLLAQSIEKQQLSAPKLISVLTSSEKLTPKMRQTIEKVFQCKVFDAYSGMEACGLISENSYGEMLFSPDSGILEVLDIEGNQVDLGEEGEVVSTGFLNYNQPLIRYKIGDRVKIAKDQQTLSGVEMLKIEEIEGRNEDVIIGSDGQKMVRFHSIFVGIQAVVMAQIIQNSLENILIKLVVDKDYTIEQELLMRERIKSQLGNLTIDFSYVKAIEKTQAGKFKAVISNLRNE